MPEFFDRRRSRRLRKKLHVGEFQEFGFDVAVTFSAVMARGDEDAYIDDLLAQVIEPRSLGYAGWVRGGFIAPADRGSASEQDREEVRRWLDARSEVVAVEIGPLRDAWYGCDR